MQINEAGRSEKPYASLGINAGGLASSTTLSVLAGGKILVVVRSIQPMNQLERRRRCCNAIVVGFLVG